MIKFINNEGLDPHGEICPLITGSPEERFPSSEGPLKRYSP